MALIGDSHIQSKIKRIRDSLLSLEDVLSQELTITGIPECSLQSEEFAGSPRPQIHESSEIAHLKQLLEAEKENVSNLKRRLSHKEKLINDLKLEGEKLQKSLAQTLEENRALFLKLTNANKLLQTSELEVKKLNAEKQDCYTQEVADIKAKLVEIESQNTGVLSEVQRLRSLVKNREEKIAKLTEERGRFGKEIEVFHRKMIQLDKENKEFKQNTDKILHLLKIETINDAAETISQMINNKDELLRTAELVQKIGILIAELSPPSSFVGNVPSHAQIWTWLSNLVNQFMKYKQSSQIIYDLSALMGVAPVNLVKKVRSLLNN